MESSKPQMEVPDRSEYDIRHIEISQSLLRIVPFSG